MTSDAYKRAGVDIDTAGRLVERIKTLASATRRAGMHGDIGGFGALFDLAAAGYRDPILVASTDGVGTKLKVAFAADIHTPIGIDLDRGAGDEGDTPGKVDGDTHVSSLATPLEGS